MVRKQLYLPVRLDRELKAEAKRRGISQAELIRQRLERDGATSASAFGRARTPAEQRGLQEAFEALQNLRKRTKPGPGTGWKFNREELYAERLDRISRR